MIRCEGWCTYHVEDTSGGVLNWTIRTHTVVQATVSGGLTQGSGERNGVRRSVYFTNGMQLNASGAHTALPLGIPSPTFSAWGTLLSEIRLIGFPFVRAFQNPSHLVGVYSSLCMRVLQHSLHCVIIIHHDSSGWMLTTSPQCLLCVPS